MSASLRHQRAWRYPAVSATGDDIQATQHAVALAPTTDGAYWVAYAPQKGRESTVALRRTTILRAVFTVGDDVPVLDSDLWRLQRTGTLYSVTAINPLPASSQIIFEAEGVERGQYSILEDVPEYTAAVVIVTPPTLNLSVGTVRRLTATVTNAGSRVLPDRPVRWSSSDRGVFNIDAQGRGEAFGAGTATITATAGDVTGTATVTVT